MPHHESPPQAHPTVVVNGSNGPAPSAEDISATLNTIFTTSKSQESLDASYQLVDQLAAAGGFRGLRGYGVLDAIRKAATDKKTPAKREGAMFALGALFEKFPRIQPVSEVVFLLQDETLIPLALDLLADKSSTVKESAQFALDELFNNLKVEALPTTFLPALQRYLKKVTGKWQGTVGALAMMARMADKAKIGTGSQDEERQKDILRSAMGRRLQELIPTVEANMHDLKSEVAKQALKTMTSICTLLQNDDVGPKIPALIKAMEKPGAESLAGAIHLLSQTTFVAEVDSPVLALLTPMLERSLNSPQTPQDVLRKTTVVTENLTKLVHDPMEARTFLPRLKPGVKGVKDRASLPEVREIATRALDVIEKAMGEGADAATMGTLEKTTPKEVLAVLDKEVAAHGGLVQLPGDDQVWDLTKVFISEMVAEDVNQRELKRIPLCTAPYLQPLMKGDNSSAVAEALEKFYIAEDERKFGEPIKPDDGEVEIVNATFSLGYGARLLLSHTNLKLLKGHRYGLCGRNGAGKSTLMRSIADNKLDGFPPPEEVKTWFVEHNQGEDADLSILEYICADPRFKDEPRERIINVLEQVGFDSGPEGRQSNKVGSLSGGWKMKLALAKAMLFDADVFLLDEPTNHLDVANIAWLQEYLKTHTEITSLIVSHDSGFLDAVCTDILHYEQKKLVPYRGNLAAFVKQKPEARSYYTLTDSQVQFKFPPPGILTGVKSNTRSILRMTNCTFTYPHATKPNLNNVTCALTLSSRVAIIGANGAGKSTLIKVLTGEVIPQEGKVEKHPNLRIGYIKQHALEHVEMHMEKTPNQYLQWRYANGDDREVLMKQTRVLSDEDKEQMDKMVDLKDGKGGRQIENLIGRQKYKKSFQYEVKWRNMLPKHNVMISRETLLDLGFQKLIQEFDDHEASREGLGFRVLEPKVISKHFDDVGLDPEIADHNTISGLSGGQKVKVVLAGAMWNNPHLLVLDEPTNFLDRDSMGGLAAAIRDYKGGVVMISHNEEFVGALCPEQWHVVDGRVTHKGHLAVDQSRFEDGTGSGVASSNVSSAQATPGTTPGASAANSDAEHDPMNFRAKKKKKKTKKELKEREVRRRLRHIEWLNSPKGTPHPPDTDDDE